MQETIERQGVGALDDHLETAVIPKPDALPIFRRIAWRKIVLFIISLFLFILGLTQMKESAAALAPLVQNHFSIHNAFNSLGFGWLFATLIMSGSPVAAVALAFFDAGIIDALATFTMITGSRLGASFIVLLIGFLYVLRGHDRRDSLGMGLLSIMVTGSTHILGLVIGIKLLQVDALASWQLQSGVLLTSFTDLIINPIMTILLGILPRWLLFIVGLATMMASLSLFDRCLPQMTLKESQVGHVSQFIYRPWVMFLLGAAITLISMSVSVSLSILVPLSNRGFVRRENVIPYIMGANITTFIDTLLAAVLLNNTAAFTIVLVEMISIALVSMVILAFFYRPYAAGILHFTSQTSSSNRYLSLFMALILLIPIFLLWLF